MALSGGGGHLGGQRGPGRHMLAACDIPLGRPTVKVESQIGALAGSRPDFPADGLTTTELGTHLAGIAVRSALVQSLVASERGGRPEPGRAEAPWTRFRGALPDSEAELARFVREADAALSLGWYEGLCPSS